MKLNKMEENFIDELVDSIDCSLCPCQYGCNVRTNLGCMIRIYNGWLKDKMENFNSLEQEE